ncbi:MAG: glutamate--tRNA ligase [Patescibacteria group bacterium]|nr:glutamate--tRNA ligase [Patescibacteria group bacterium]MDD5490469.1 glutamate--tRNA ligase [Patescibacteria group bacterium]
MSKPKIRVRIAPSPTGNLHIGTARSALFNYLFAKKNKGDFIVRIEDTDLERSGEQYTKNIIEGLRWLEIEWDEGPEKSGKYGPYFQSQRTEIYSDYLKKLLDNGTAYYCYCTEEELDKERAEMEKQGIAPRYSGRCRHLTEEQKRKFESEGRKPIIRFKVESKKIKFNDLIRGEIEFDTDLIGDITIAKDLNTPLYNFAVVIDDYTMEISHVIRGEDHISNTPKQLLIFEALGLTPPVYGHLPLILGSDKSKMSKRHGATSILEYRENGYLPEALVNFMAFLGWNPGDEREIFSLKDLIKEFSIEKTHKTGAIFNVEKLDWFNSYYIKQKSIKELTKLCVPFLAEGRLIQRAGSKFEITDTKELIDSEYLEKIVALEQGRIKKLKDIDEATNYFFFDSIKYEPEILIWKKSDKEATSANLKNVYKILSELKEKDFEPKKLEKILLGICGEDRGAVLWPLRVALCGRKASPGPFDIAAILGKEKTLKRINDAINTLK